MVKKFLNLLLFGNFWIAACSVALTWQTELLLFKQVETSSLSFFVFFATLFLYAIHRIVGLEKVKPFLEKHRYSIIYTFRHHIKLYAFIGGAAALYHFFYLSFYNQFLLILPAILSLGYVLPFLSGRKRLRDINFLKIFLVAIVWGVITVIMPILETTDRLTLSHLLILMERIAFIFAITLPFDIRDLKIDTHLNVKTIPSQIGIQRTKNLAYGSLGLVCLLAIANSILQVYSLTTVFALFLSCSSTAYLIQKSDQTDNDYFFTGLLDGTMLLQFILVLISQV